jgi:hypothetical protein
MVALHRLFTFVGRRNDGTILDCNASALPQPLLMKWRPSNRARLGYFPLFCDGSLVIFGRNISSAPLAT